MLVTIDIGNTNVKLGVYQVERLLAHWRLATERFKLADEYAALILTLFALVGIDKHAISGCAISCVVPPLTSQFLAFSRNYLGVEPEPAQMHASPAVNRAPGRFVRASGMALPFGDGTVDICLSSNVAEHVPDPWRLGDEMLRVTRPGGLAVLSYTV